jgi:hypothetical protein
MAGMGPPPKPDDQRRRRNATVALTRLPAEGRRKRAPNWPLIPDVVLEARRDIAAGKVAIARSRVEDLQDAGKPTGPAEAKLQAAEERLLVIERQLAAQRRLEASLWRDLWSLPQAVMWERLGWTRDVAQYVRHKVMAELGELDAAKEARQWSDRLGLSPMAMLRLRWEVVADEVGDRRSAQAASKPPTSARQRLKVVDAAASRS